jgi:hypothetical protein
MQGNMGKKFHGYKEKTSFFIKQGWTEQTNTKVPFRNIALGWQILVSRIVK